MNPCRGQRRTRPSCAADPLWRRSIERTSDSVGTRPDLLPGCRCDVAGRNDEVDLGPFRLYACRRAHADADATSIGAYHLDAPAVPSTGPGHRLRSIGYTTPKTSSGPVCRPGGAAPPRGRAGGRSRPAGEPGRRRPAQAAHGVARAARAAGLRVEVDARRAARCAGPTARLRRGVPGRGRGPGSGRRRRRGVPAGGREPAPDAGGRVRRPGQPGRARTKRSALARVSDPGVAVEGPAERSLARLLPPTPSDPAVHRRSETCPSSLEAAGQTPKCPISWRIGLPL